MNTNEPEEKDQSVVKDNEDSFEFKKNEQNELDYIISMMKEKDQSISNKELGYCQRVKYKFGYRLIYASMLLYGLKYQLWGEEEDRELWVKFSDAVKRYSEDDCNG